MSKIFILMGLPGSGKTYFAKEYYKTHHRTAINNFQDVHIVDVDNFLKNHKLEKIGTYFGIGDNKSTYILDGLFLKNNDVISIIHSLKQDIPLIHGIESITIHYWIPDREACLYNDIGRRKKSSKITIQYATMEQPSIDLIQKITGYKVDVKKHIIVRKPEWKAIAESYSIDIDDEKYLYSDKWCLGGTCGSCYSSELSRISPDEPILEFSQLDSFLEDIFPNLLFIDYKKIKKECVTTKTDIERDYYGGCVEYAYLVCDIEKLFNILIELKYINTKDQI